MRFSNLVTCLFFLLPALVASKSIFIDKTCKNRHDWKKFWDEANHFAKSAHTRIKSDTDKDFKNVLTRIFGGTTTPQKNYIRGWWSGLKSCA
jgi:hypothetical protein